MHPRRFQQYVVPLALAFASLVAAQDITLPNAADDLKFAIIGDSGTGSSSQFAISDKLVGSRAKFPYEFVLMMGDNLYSGSGAKDFEKKFEKPYKPLLDAGVKFYAALGNHDNPNERFYKGFNMSGERYYTFDRKNARFYVFDSNMLDPQQLDWIDRTLQQPYDGWKICYFHHPLYSDAGRHGPDIQLRVVLEPLLVRSGVNVVFSGHEHVYERLTPQKGITYFIDGSGGQLRKGDMVPSATTAASFDQDQTFMLVEIVGAEMTFQTISRTGRTVDSGVVRRRPTS